VSIPIRARLTLWYGALLAAALVLFAGTVYAVMANALLANLDATLASRLDHVTTETKIANGLPTLPRDEERVDQPVIPAVLIAPSGRITYGSLPGQLRSALPANPPSDRHFVTVGNLRVATAPIARRGHLIGTTVVWESQRAVNEARGSLLLIMLATGPALLLIAILGGFALASRALRPLTALTQTAAAISATDLSRRVPVGPARDELSDLATTFNAMIDRLEGAVRRERRFTADASHELRSPLSVIRAEATLALERPRSEEEYRRALQALDEQASGMEDLIAALLALARTESTPEGVGPCVVADLVAEAIAEVLAGRQPTAIESAVPEDLVVRGSATLLVRALRNLIDNAARFSPSGGTVHVRAWAEGTLVVIEVGDEGPGIAPEHQERIFEPFYQIQAARTPGSSHGLGLSICRRVVEAYGGQVTLLPPGSTGAVFRIDLPAAMEKRA
jgi:signal transduction histidine kinase